MVKVFCQNCKAKKEIAFASKTKIGKKKTITAGKCETCGKPLRLIELDLSKKEVM